MIELQDHIEADRLPQLMALFAGEWWTTGRAIEDVGAMLRGSDLVFALVDRVADRLVGFARVITDGIHVAMILDVIIAAQERKAGLGARLMDAVVRHPRLKNVRSVELVCQPELVPFYRRWGFTDQVGLSRLMRLTTDRTLISRHIKTIVLNSSNVFGLALVLSATRILASEKIEMAVLFIRTHENFHKGGRVEIRY